MDKFDISARFALMERPQYLLMVYFFNLDYIRDTSTPWLVSISARTCPERALKSGGALNHV